MIDDINIAQVENVILVDGYLNMAKTQLKLRQLAELILSILQYLLNFSDEEKKRYLEVLEKTDTDKLVPFALNIFDVHSKSPNEELRKTWDRAVTAMILMLEYKPSPGLEVKVHYIVAQGSLLQEFDPSPDYYFQKLCVNHMSLHYVSGNHTSCLEDPFVQQMADAVNNILESNNNQQPGPQNKK